MQRAECLKEMMLRALVVVKSDHNPYGKQGIGRLSAYCGARSVQDVVQVQESVICMADVHMRFLM